MKILLMISCFWAMATLAIAQPNNERNYTDYKPEYRKWKDSYILDKIEYQPEATIFYFRFICDNLNSGGAIFYPPGGKYAWYLKGKDVQRDFPLVAVKNIRRDGILIKREVKDAIFDSPPSDITGYTIFSCEVHFGPLDNEVTVADLIEGPGQEYNRLHFNCFDIKLKTWDDETLGSEEDSQKAIEEFEKKAGKSTQKPPVEEQKPPVEEQKPPVEEQKEPVAEQTTTPKEETVVNVARPESYTTGRKYLQQASDLVCNQVLILGGIHFQDNSTNYKGIIAARKNIELLAAYLKENPTATITLYGHTDIFGDKENNMELSKARAIKIQRWLSMYGIPPKRITCEWFGPDQPLKPEGDPVNRRVEARLVCGG